ncbi:MAG: hypothetical protein R2813_01010 [Flavobacteriales bacterium]
MKILIAFFLGFVLCLSSIAQRHKAEEYSISTREYTGTFTDLNEVTGQLQLYVNIDNSDNIDGIAVLRISEDSAVSGNISGSIKITDRYVGNSGPIIFQPSLRKTSMIHANSNLAPDYLQTSSYQCDWHIVIENPSIEMKSLKGKAVPRDCLYSNLIEFELILKEQ